MPFDASPDGSVLVCVSDSELRVHANNDDRCLWHCSLEKPLAHVFARRNHLLALRSDGLLQAWKLLSGDALDTAQIQEKELQFSCAATDGTLALGGPSETTLVASDFSRQSGLPAATEASFDRSGKSLLFLTTKGAVLCARDGAVLARNEALTATRVASLPNDRWIAANGTHLEVWERKQDTLRKSVLPRVESESFAHLCTSEEGHMVAWCSSENEVRVASTADGQHIARIVYERPVVGLALLPNATLAVGLDGCDANRIELNSERVFRTDPPEGATRTRWKVQHDIDGGLVRILQEQALPKQRESIEPVAILVLSAVGLFTAVTIFKHCL